MCNQTGFHPMLALVLICAADPVLCFTYFSLRFFYSSEFGKLSLNRCCVHVVEQVFRKMIIALRADHISL